MKTKKHNKCSICNGEHDIGIEKWTAFKKNNLCLCDDCRQKFYKFIRKTYGINMGSIWKQSNNKLKEVMKMIKKDPYFLFLFW